MHGNVFKRRLGFSFTVIIWLSTAVKKGFITKALERKANLHQKF